MSRAASPEAVELLRDLNVEPSELARNAVPPSECTRAGRWIDVATGKVIVEQRDFALGAASPLVFDRTWLSTSTYGGPVGHGWHHTYDLALACGSDIVAVRMADGRVVWLPPPSRAGGSYDSDERLSLTRDRYGYGLRDAAGTEFRFVPHRAQAAFVLGSLRACDGQELRFGYDHRSRLVRITDRRGVDLELGYDAEDRILEVRAPDPQRTGKRVVLVQYAYDPRGNLRKASDALGQTRRYGYEKKLMIVLVDRNGCTSHFEWDGQDARAQCVHTWTDGGLHDRTLEYAEGGTRVRDSLGRETAFGHAAGLVDRAFDAAGNLQEITRGPGRRVEGEVNELGQLRRRVYDARGNLIETRAPDGGTCGFEFALVRRPVESPSAFDDRDRLLRVVDALGGSWVLAYDERGRLVRLTDPLGQATRLHHRGRWLVGVTDPNGQQTGFTYDDAGQLAACTTPDGNRTRYSYDVWGQLVGVVDPHGNREQREYDVLGRLIRVHEPDGNRLELAYDAEGNCVRLKDSQHDVRFTYQGTGRISSRSEGGFTVCFEYDSEEQLVAIVNEDGNLLRLQRGPTGRVIETRGFDGCIRRYLRDTAGGVERVERGGEFSEYDRDAAGRVIEVQHSDGAFEGYQYRADGALLSAWNQSTTLSFERDALGRITREQQAEHSVEYVYSAAGDRVEVRSSLGTRQILERDAAGALQRIAEIGSGFESRVVRDALGLEIERTLPCGGRSAWQRDVFGRPGVHRLESAAGELVHKLVYEWELSGRLRRIADSRRGTTEYRYDAIGNLAWFSTGTGSYQLRMPDGAGNVFSREDRRDREYGPAGQVLVRSEKRGEVQHQYDPQGNLIERREPDGRCWRYTWSAAGSLSRVTDPDGHEVCFVYDPLGRRVSKQYRGQTTRFVWAGARLLHEWVEGELCAPSAASARADEEVPTLVIPGGRSSPSAHGDTARRVASNTSARGSDAREPALAALLAQPAYARGTRQLPVTWVFDPDTGWPLAKLGSAGALAIVADHAGTPRFLLNDQGTPLWAAEESIGGELRVLEGERHACLLRRGGMYEDLETGLYCGGQPARYYDPEAGGYLCQGSTTARPTLRAYALEPEPPLRVAEPAAPHQWLTRAPASRTGAMIPWPQAAFARLVLPRTRGATQAFWRPTCVPVPRVASAQYPLLSRLDQSIPPLSAAAGPAALVACVLSAAFDGEDLGFG